MQKATAKWRLFAVFGSIAVLSYGGDSMNALASSNSNINVNKRPVITGVEHVVLHKGTNTYCGHPRQCVFQYFGGGEMIVGHNHAPCNYATNQDVAHDFGGYHSRSQVLVQRSLDGGKTWPENLNVVVWDETMPDEWKKAFLHPEDPKREDYDMFKPSSCFFFGRTYLSGNGVTKTCFSLRSDDKGKTWEKTPTIISEPSGKTGGVHKDCHPIVKMRDGKTLLAAMSLPDCVGVYSSTNNGLSWEYLSAPATNDTAKTGRYTYAGLLLLPDNELQCYVLNITYERNYNNINGNTNAICMTASRDNGKTWGPLKPIVGKGDACWKEFKRHAGGGWHYRSPWPILLKDGRILVVFARRHFPFGIGGVVSADNGRTWSDEFVIRADDASCDDLGYPVGSQLDDGSVFIAYYYNDAGTKESLKAVRYIAGTIFRLE